MVENFLRYYIVNLIKTSYLEIFYSCYSSSYLPRLMGSEDYVLVDKMLTTLQD